MIRLDRADVPTYNTNGYFFKNITKGNQRGL